MRELPLPMETDNESPVVIFNPHQDLLISIGALVVGGALAATSAILYFTYEISPALLDPAARDNLIIGMGLLGTAITAGGVLGIRGVARYFSQRRKS